MNRPVVVIPSNVPWDWTIDHARKTSLSLAPTCDVVVLFWEDAFSLKDIFKGLGKPLLGQLAPNCRFFRMFHIIPFRRFAAVTTANLVLNAAIVRFAIWCSSPFGNRRKALWITDPLFAPILGVFRGYRTVYDCIDFAWHPYPVLYAKVQRLEKTLLGAADVVCVNSYTLRTIHRAVRPDTVLVPQGVGPTAQTRRAVTVNRRFGTGPVIGFVGGLGYRLDFLLLTRLATAHPKWRFVLWGPLQDAFDGDYRVTENIRRLSELPNVTIGESASRLELPSVIGSFDVAIIPLNTSLPFVRYGYPYKFLEYAAAGKPVVSSPIREMKRFSPPVIIARTFTEWEQAIRRVLAHPETYRTRGLLKASDIVPWRLRTNRILSLVFPKNLPNGTVPPLCPRPPHTGR